MFRVYVLLEELISKLFFILKYIPSLFKLLGQSMFFIILAFCFLITMLYAYPKYKDNYYFDQIIFKYADRTLKRVMQHHIMEIRSRSMEPTYFHIDIDRMLVALLELGYHDLRIVNLTVNECPGNPMRMSDADFLDIDIYKNITIDRDERYTTLKVRRKLKMRLMELSQNVKLYHIYSRTDCPNHHIFKQNLELYRNQLISIPLAPEQILLPYGKYWFIRYHNFIYLGLETDGIQAHNLALQSDNVRRNLIWQKITLEQFREYEYGKYYDFLQSYRITDALYAE